MSLNLTPRDLNNLKRVLATLERLIPNDSDDLAADSRLEDYSWLDSFLAGILSTRRIRASDAEVSIALNILHALGELDTTLCHSAEFADVLRILKEAVPPIG